MSVGVRISLAALLTLGAGPRPAPPVPAACVASEHRQFDFWIGDWDVFDVGNPDSVKARAHIDPMLDGCALRELYEGRTGLTGQSVNIYDAARRLWHQSWVTNRGQLLVLEGGMDGQRMILTGTDPAAGVLLRGIWVPAEGGVRETAETSADRGKTWKPLFDLMFRKHAP